MEVEVVLHLYVHLFHQIHLLHCLHGFIPLQCSLSIFYRFTSWALTWRVIVKLSANGNHTGNYFEILNTFFYLVKVQCKDTIILTLFCQGLADGTWRTRSSFTCVFTFPTKSTSFIASIPCSAPSPSSISSPRVHSLGK